MPQLTYDEMAHRMAQCSAVVKLICGVANNAAWVVVLKAHDHAKQCATYRQGVKRQFKAAIDALHQYERQLVHSPHNRMFHVADMTPEIRKKYGDISDREFYDFWASVGNYAYQQTEPLLSSLWNKYRKSLIRDGIAEADHVAWVMVGMAALELSVQMYGDAINECVNGHQLPRRIVEYVFRQFSLAPVASMWRKALEALCPGTDELEPSDIDKRNIQLGLEQLRDAWMNPSLLFNSTMDSVEDYGEIFRTKGEQKKSMREIAEVRDDTMRELEKT